jgi:sugar phosphate permease
MLRLGRAVGRFGPAPIAIGSFVCLVGAYAVFLRAGIHPDYPGVMLPSMILIGFAFGLGFTALSLAATDGIPDAEQGLAASLFQTSFQVGGAIVLAIVTAVIDAGAANHALSARATLNAYRPALTLLTAVAAGGLAVAVTGVRPPGSPVWGSRRATRNVAL